MPPAKYKFRASDSFWKAFYQLSDGQKASTRGKWKIFKENPFDVRLRTHSINRLSALRKRTIWSVVIEGDLRCLFEINGDTVITIAIGTHDLYKASKP